MNLSFILQLIFMLLLSGCFSQSKRIEPPYPSVRTGWIAKEERSINIQGVFVLKLNDSIDNGKVQIQVIGLIPRDERAEFGSYASQDKVKLRFKNIEDSSILCEKMFFAGESASLIGDKVCGTVASDYGIPAIYIKAINITDSWVHFEIAH